MYTVENFIEGFKAIFPRTTANTADGVINFSRTSLGNYDTIFCKMSVDDIETEIRSLSNTILNDDLILTNENYYEMPVKPNDSMRIPLYRAYENGDFLEERHSYKFNICKSSPKYIVALICYLSNNKDKKLDFMSLRHRIIHSNPIESFKDFCDVFPVVTVQILAPQSCSIVEFSNLFKSYAFNIAYVNNVVFSKTDLVEPTRSRRCSVNRSGQLFPYKKTQQRTT